MKPQMTSWLQKTKSTRDGILLILVAVTVKLSREFKIF